MRLEVESQKPQQRNFHVPKLSANPVSFDSNEDLTNNYTSNFEVIDGVDPPFITGFEHAPT